MKFNYSDDYKPSTEHFKIAKAFDDFLEQLSNNNKEEFSKELYTSGRFIAFGFGSRGTIYIPSPEMPADIEKQIRDELSRLSGL